MTNQQQRLNQFNETTLIWLQSKRHRKRNPRKVLQQKKKYANNNNEEKWQKSNDTESTVLAQIHKVMDKYNVSPDNKKEPHIKTTARK